MFALLSGTGVWTLKMSLVHLVGYITYRLSSHTFCFTADLTQSCTLPKFKIWIVIFPHLSVFSLHKQAHGLLGEVCLCMCVSSCLFS